MGGGLHIIQKRKGFKYGTDSILLAKYTLMHEDLFFGRKRERFRCVDFGTGTGILPLLLSRRDRFTELIGLELQKEYAQMAARSVALSDLSSRIRILEGDLRQAETLLGRNAAEVVVANPPYKRVGAGLLSDSASEAVCRHEITCTLEDVIRSASAVLIPGGVFYMVNRPERLADAVQCLRTYRLEPKHIQLVYPRADRRPTLFLSAAVKGGGTNLTVERPLILYDTDGRETKDLRDFYAY